MAHVPKNHKQPPLQEQVDGQMASNLALDARDQHNQPNTTAQRSLAQALINILAFKVKQAPENYIPYAKIVLVMRDQATYIWELEQNLERMRAANDEQCHHDWHHRGCREHNHNELCHHLPQHHSKEPNPRNEDRSREKERVFRREPRSEHSQHYDHAESHPT